MAFKLNFKKSIKSSVHTLVYETRVKYLKESSQFNYENILAYDYFYFYLLIALDVAINFPGLWLYSFYRNLTDIF